MTASIAESVYVSQIAYPHIEYRTDIRHPENIRYAQQGDIRCAGCGICSACMMVHMLTGNGMSKAAGALCTAETGMQAKQAEVEAFRDLSYLAGANRELGTDMVIYGKALAERFGLRMILANESRDLVNCLQTGGTAIINVGGDREGYTGVFSDEGHFILASGYREQTNEVEILDPSFTKDKFFADGRRGKVRVKGVRCYTGTDVLEADTENRTPRYYLFWKAA